MGMETNMLEDDDDVLESSVNPLKSSPRHCYVSSTQAPPLALSSQPHANATAQRRLPSTLNTLGQIVERILTFGS